MSTAQFSRQRGRALATRIRGRHYGKQLRTPAHPARSYGAFSLKQTLRSMQHPASVSAQIFRMRMIAVYDVFTTTLVPYSSASLRR